MSTTVALSDPRTRYVRALVRRGADLDYAAGLAARFFAAPRPKPKRTAGAYPWSKIPKKYRGTPWALRRKPV